MFSRCVSVIEDSEIDISNNLGHMISFVLLQNSLVIDGSGSWLSSFKSQTQNMGVKTMRLPITIHPSPKPLALRYYAEKNMRTDEFVALENSAPAPSSKIFIDFCENLTRKLPKQIQSVVQDTVVDIESTSFDSQRIVKIELTSGKAVAARSVVIATSGCQPVTPKWISDHNAHSIADISTYDRVDVSDSAQRLDEKVITIFGGGMSAATMALRALDLGAKHVYMITRRQLCKQLFDSNPGWWGMKYLNAFEILPDIDSRIRMCQQARERGTVTPMTWDMLVQQQAEGMLDVIEGVDVMSFNRDEKMHIRLQKNSQLMKKDYSSLDSTLNKTQFVKDVTTCRMEGVTLDANIPEELKSNKAPDSLTCDQIWIACGNAFNVRQHAILSKLLDKYPTNHIGGYPDLSASCRWPGVPVFIAGRGSLLKTGPCAKNMVGMRMSAEKICSGIREILDGRGEGADDKMHAAQGNLFDPVNRVHEWISYSKDSDDMNTQQVPLESENIIPARAQQNRQKATGSESIDIDDIDPTIPRSEVQNFAFADEDFKVSVIIPVSEDIPKDCIRMRVTNTSMEAWLLGKKTAYHLHIPKLYGKVLPERSKIISKEGKKRVTLILHKEKDSEWKFLRG